MGLRRRGRIELSSVRAQGVRSGPFRGDSQSTLRLRLGDDGCFGWRRSSVSPGCLGRVGDGKL